MIRSLDLSNFEAVRSMHTVKYFLHIGGCLRLINCNWRDAML